MVTIIKKGFGKEKLQKTLENLRVTKGFRAFQYCGKGRLDKHPLELQQEFRDEWK